jgi:hypothetical protein
MCVSLGQARFHDVKDSVNLVEKTLRNENKCIKESKSMNFLKNKIN